MSLPPDSPFLNLNAIILSIEWEISDAIMDRLLEEVDTLKERFKGDKTIFSFLQLHGSVGKYIRLKKVEAHPDSIKLLHTVHSGLIRVLSSSQMTETEKKEILSEEIIKFRALKEQIVKPASADSTIGKPARTEDGDRSEPERDTASVSESSGCPPLPEPFVTAIEDMKRFVKKELDALREELNALKKEP